MADQISNITIPISDLPPLTGYSSEIVLRYRIVSDDKNSVSAWTNPKTSEIFGSPYNNNYSLHQVNATNDTFGNLSISWEKKDGLPFNSSDLFVKWMSSAGDVSREWTYVGLVQGTGHTMFIPKTIITGPSSSYSVTHFQIAIQVPTITKEVESPLDPAQSKFLMVKTDITDISGPA